MKKVKIGDIANRSGVSPTTVSRYFNRPELLAADTRERIEAAIKELNYNQDHLARILVTGKSNLVGVIFPHLHLSFYSELLNQLIKLGKQKDYSFIVYTSRESREEEKALVQNLLSYRVKGIILLSHMLDAADIEALPVPIVAIERPGGNFQQISSDNFTGGKLAGELLMRNNCDVLIHINNGYHEDWPSFKRIVGFEFTIRDWPHETLIEPDLTDPYSTQAMAAMDCIADRLLKQYRGKKLGIFCSNDDIANLLQRACISRNVRIPHEIEIIGYDNSPVSDYAVYPITSIDQNIPLMAKIAIEALDSYTPHESFVPATLVQKKTTMP